jgi:glycosyltransferase involved in cell wall biosynthesis
MSAVKFSVIITSYNQREFIEDAVDFALALPNVNKEIIVVDDGSTDGSQDALGRYGDAIRLVRLEINEGAGAARNRGASLATGEFLVFLDGDDTFVPWALDVYGCIVEAKGPKMILAKMRWFEGTLPVIRPDDTPHQMRIVEYQDYLRKDRPFGNSASALVVDRQCFYRAQGWSTDIWPMNDQDLTLRLCDCGRTIQILEPPTTLHRSHASNTVKYVPPYLPSLYKIIQNNQSGYYSGGEHRSFERRALIGALVVFWAKRAVKAGLYHDALKLLVRGRQMASVAVALRLWRIIRGRRAVETISM